MYLRPSGHIYRRDFNTLSVALATGYRSACSASQLGSRRGMVPVRSARTPQFEERVYQWSRRHRKGSACGCGFRQGGTCRDGRHTGTGRYAVRPPLGGRCRAPPGGLLRGRRSRACAPPLPAAVRAETGVIRELGDTWLARLSAGVVDLEVGVPLPACCKSEQPCAVSWSARPAYKGRTPGPDGPGVPV